MVLGLQMSARKEIENGLEKVVAKFKDTDLKEHYKRFSKSIQFVYPDLDLSYVMEISCGKVEELREGTKTRPDIYVKIDSETFLDILKGKTNALDAYSKGKIKYIGAMTDLLKLQRLL
jgi:putative sterol carrier protein